MEVSQILGRTGEFRRVDDDVVHARGGRDQGADRVDLTIQVAHHIERHDRNAPVTRSVKRLTLALEAGERRVRMRVNQRRFGGYGDGRWQASLRFRTLGDELSDVRGR